MRSVVGLIFHAPMGESRVEQEVEAGRWASTLGLARHLRAVGLPTYMVAPDSRRREGAEPGITFLRSDPPESFHLGNTLRRLATELDADGLLYFGSGAGALMTEQDLAPLVEFARGDTARAVFNNFYSCDFCALSCAKDVLQGDLPATDNPLGFALADAGIPCFALTRTAATQFDIDTPTDLLLLARHGAGNPELQTFCAAMDRAHPTLDRALKVLTDRSAVTCIVGRVSPVTWSHFESEVACRTSALVEGRGMRAGASSHVPWLRQAIEQDGPLSFFGRLERACDAAWIDTRPLLGTGDLLPPAAVRFSSDLFRVEDVLDPAWRAFAEAARSSSIPVVLGGHSLVSGGLYLAAAACWKGRNLVRRLHPEPFA
jgi:hypothetical protein